MNVYNIIIISYVMIITLILMIIINSIKLRIVKFITGFNKLRRVNISIVSKEKMMRI